MTRNIFSLYTTLTPFDNWRSEFCVVRNAIIMWRYNIKYAMAHVIFNNPPAATSDSLTITIVPGKITDF